MSLKGCIEYKTQTNNIHCFPGARMEIDLWSQTLDQVQYQNHPSTIILNENIYTW
jgi:hypothetical protein